MPASSCTPDGASGECPICGHIVSLEFSSFPTLDAPCPFCGHLLWYESPYAQREDFLPLATASDYQTAHKRGHVQAGFTFERTCWAIISLISAIMISCIDGLGPGLLFWLVVLLAFGQYLLPALLRSAAAWPPTRDNLYVGVLLGWALVPGPVVGVFAGILLPPLLDWPMLSLIGGLAGLLLGPCFTMAQGGITLLVVDLACWLFTGRRLSRKL